MSLFTSTLLVVDLPSCDLLFCKCDPLTHPTSQSIPEGGGVLAAKATRVADVAIYGPTIKGHPKGLDNFLFILRVIHLSIGMGVALFSEDCRW